MSYDIMRTDGGADQNPDQAAAELATASVVVAVEDLAETVATGGSLALQEHAAKRHNVAIAIANSGIVGGLLNELPRDKHDDYHGSKIKAHDLLELRHILATTTFWRGDDPHYLIGEKRQDGRWSDILLATQYKPGYEPHIMRTTVTNKQLERNRELAGANLTRPFSSGEYDEFEKQRTGNFVLKGRHIPGAAKIDGRHTKWGKFRGVPPAKDLPEGQLPEDMWNDYKVSEHLARIATIFGKAELLDKLLAKNRAIAYEPTPSEQALAEEA